MKVLLKQDVDNLGYAGEVYRVADGYGRNYLIPQGYAVMATESVMKQAEHWRKKADTRRAELRAEYEALSGRIKETTLTFVARAGDGGKLYGSVTTAQITDELNEVLGTEIDRRKVGAEPLRQLGEHKVVVRLGPDFQPHVLVIIESEDQVEAARAEVVEEEIILEAVAEVLEEAEEELEIEAEEEDFDEKYDEYLDETG